MAALPYKSPPLQLKFLVNFLTMSQNCSSLKSFNHDNSQPSVAHGKCPCSNDASDTEAASNNAGSNHLLCQKQQRRIDSEEAEVLTPGDDEPSANASSSMNDTSR